MANPFAPIEKVATITNTASSIDMGSEVGAYTIINLGPVNVSAGTVVQDVFVNDTGGTAVASDTNGQYRLKFGQSLTIPKTTAKVFSLITASGSTVVQIIGIPEQQAS